jgi:hypothetical protein
LLFLLSRRDLGGRNPFFINYYIPSMNPNAQLCVYLTVL